MDNPRAGLSTKGKPGISESPQDLGPGFSVGQLQAQSNAKMAAWMGGMYQMKKKKKKKKKKKSHQDKYSSTPGNQPAL